MPTNRIPIPITITNWLNYNPETGILTWRRSPGPRSPEDSVAGSLNGDGYLTIQFSNKSYQAHRIAWYLHYKTDPGELEIDHDNGIKTDNRISNLRPATHQQNSFNSTKSSTNTSGIKGISWDSKSASWRARVMINSKSVHVGRFHTIEQAQKAIEFKRLELHKEFANHGFTDPC